MSDTFFFNLLNERRELATLGGFWNNTLRLVGNTSHRNCINNRERH